MSVLFSLLYWTFCTVAAVVLFPGAVLIWAATASFDPTRRLLHLYTCWWSRLYLRCLPGCRIEVEGREKIRPRTPYVLVANHQSATDIMALAALAVPFKWTSKKENFRIPIIGWNMSLNGTVKVDRGNVRGVEAVMAACRSWLKRGVPVMVFPEGHRSATGELLRFHGGAFKLAAACGCAVVPIVVDGTRPIYQGLRVCAFPGRVTVRVLDPVGLADAGGSVLGLRDLVFERMRDALADLRGRPAGAAPPQEQLSAGRAGIS